MNPATQTDDQDFYKRLVDTGLALLSTETNLDRLLEEVVALALDAAKADAGTLYVIRGSELEFMVARNLTMERRNTPLPLVHHKLAINHNTICGHVACTGETLFLDDVRKLDPDLPFRFNDSFDRQLNYHSQSMLVLPLTNPTGGVVGVLQLINHCENEQFRSFPRTLLNPVLIMARQVGMALSNAILNENLREAQIETVYRLSLAAEARSKETGKHLQRVSHYTKLLARACGHDREFQELAYSAAPLHDVGKIGVPDSILKKPGPFTADERAIMETHSALGHQILAQSTSPLLQLGASIALTHHEKWDGTGYPNKLKGNDIPLEGRIVAMADVFDALTTRRCYKDAWPIDKVKEVIQTESGRQFEPTLGEAFLSHWSEVRAIFEQFRE